MISAPASWTIRYEMQGRVTQHWKYELAADYATTRAGLFVGVRQRLR